MATTSSLLFTSKALVGNMLAGFTQTILDHSANDAKVPKDNAELAFRGWMAAKEELASFEQELDDQYKERHHMPRMEARAAYEAFRLQAEQARHVYKTSGRDLDAWLRTKFQGDTVAFTDPIYTKYVNEG